MFFLSFRQITLTAVVFTLSACPGVSSSSSPTTEPAQPPTPAIRADSGTSASSPDAGTYQPNCIQKVCGDDGCSGSCGVCASPSVCDTGRCAATCTAETDSAFCARLQKQCGTLTAKDNCDVERTVGNCGTCTSPLACQPDNVCKCIAQTDAELCGARNCGTVTLSDNCGTQRSVQCGSCSAPQTCGGAGSANVCGCTPQCNGKSCGPDGCGGSCGPCPNNAVCAAAQDQCNCQDGYIANAAANACVRPV